MCSFIETISNYNCYYCYYRRHLLHLDKLEISIEYLLIIYNKTMALNIRCSIKSLLVIFYVHCLILPLSSSPCFFFVIFKCCYFFLNRGVFIFQIRILAFFLLSFSNNNKVIKNFLK